MESESRTGFILSANRSYFYLRTNEKGQCWTYIFVNLLCYHVHCMDWMEQRSAVRFIFPASHRRCPPLSTAAAPTAPWSKQAQYYVLYFWTYFRGPSSENVISSGSTVEVATGNGLNCSRVGLRVLVGAIFFSPPRQQDRFWGSPRFLSNGSWGFFTRE
jgi:hypothetical protein